MKSIPITIKTTSQEDRLKKYLNVLYKFHKITDKEMTIFLELVYKFYDIQRRLNNTQDTKSINKLLFDLESKQEIQQKLNIKDAVFQNYMTVFRKKGVILNNQIHPLLVPPAGEFTLAIKFE
jgi:hypothetical protein